MDKSKEIKEQVKNRYSQVAKRAESETTASCCIPSSDAPCCGGDIREDYAEGIGYSMEEISNLPDSVLGACAGCGNPTAIAGLREGEVVLDLGSGGGIDVFLAAKKVGPRGRAIGVDMTQDMIDLATKNATKMGFENVEFRLGDIENLPIGDKSVDVIISNCVINLAPDKDKVFSEAYRVLRPGGRITISDIITDGELPEVVKNNMDAWTSCIAGALDEREYLGKIKKAGFMDVKILSKRPYMQLAYSAEIEAYKPNSN